MRCEDTPTSRNWYCSGGRSARGSFVASNFGLRRNRMGLFDHESFIPDLLWPCSGDPHPSGCRRNPPQAPTQIAKQRRSAFAHSDERQTLGPTPMNRTVTLPADGANRAASPVKSNRPAGIAPVLAPWLLNGGR